MKIQNYNIDLKKATDLINKNNYKTVALQLPEGLKRNVAEIAGFIKDNTKSDVIVLADPCFGACDVFDSKLDNLNINLVIQIGHTEINNIKQENIKTIFINAESLVDIKKVVNKSIKYLNGKRIGIVTTAQHLHKIDGAIKILKENNFIPVISKGDNRVSHKGQILGCNFSAAHNITSKVDSFLFIGSGNFHPVGLLISTKKPVIAADPYTNDVKFDELNNLKDTILRQRYGAIAQCQNAQRFGILVGIKSGQIRVDLIKQIQMLLESHNKKSVLIAQNNFSPDLLNGFKDIDCFVSTACPRIAIDDYIQYKIPILTPIELEIVLGIRKWEDYKFDEI